MEDISLPTCPICLDCFSEIEPAYILYCGHTVHNNCLRLMKQPSNNVVCPICRHVTPGAIDVLKRNYSLMSLLAELKVDKVQNVAVSYLCYECESKANIFCEQCNIPLCESHNITIHSHKFASNHKRVNVLEKFITSQKCLLHDENKKLFCKNCLLQLCPTCQILEHDDHNVELSSIIIKDYDKEIKSTLESTQSYISQLNLQKDLLNDTLTLIEEGQQKSEKNIDSAMDTLIQNINERRETLKRQVRNETDAKKSIINQEKEILSDIKDEALNIADSLKYLKLNTDLNGMSSQTAILYQQKILSKLKAKHDFKKSDRFKNWCTEEEITLPEKIITSLTEIKTQKRSHQKSAKSGVQKCSQCQVSLKKKLDKIPN